MNQPTPTVSRADVMRVLRRDFPQASFSELQAILDEYGAQEWHVERDRVQLAILKLASGRVDLLRSQVESAKRDFRDVLSVAEYPAYLNKGFHIGTLPPEQQQAIIDADWKQYQDWLNR